MSESMIRRVPLETIEIAKPCMASWESMAGDDRARFCGHCGKWVHNLSEMPRADAERFVCTSAGSTCVRFARDGLGETITLDYQAPSPRRKRRGLVAALTLGAVASLAAALWGWAASPRARPAGGVVMGAMPMRP